LDDLRPCYRRAFEEVADESVRFELLLMPMPTGRVVNAPARLAGSPIEPSAPTGNQEIICMLVLYAEVKGAIPGVPVGGNQVIPVTAVRADDERGIRNRVQEMYTALIDGRREQIAQMYRDAQANGGVTPMNGLISPDGPPNMVLDGARKAFDEFRQGQ
jgi:hypothetical protein